MEENKKNLKITSYIIIILAIFNILLLGIGFANGQLKQEVEDIVQDTMTESGASPEEVEQSHDLVFNLSFYAIIGGTAINVLLDVYLGIKGLRQSEGKGKGKANIVWARLIIVFTIISTIMSITSPSRGRIPVAAITNILIVYYYMSCAKKVLEEKEEEKEGE